MRVDLRLNRLFPISHILVYCPLVLPRNIALAKPARKSAGGPGWPAHQADDLHERAPPLVGIETHALSARRADHEAVTETAYTPLCCLVRPHHSAHLVKDKQYSMAASGKPRVSRLSWRFFLHPRNFILSLIGLFVLIQLVPVWLLQTNPAAQAEPAWNSAATRALVATACFDCHSNYTTWPWYSHVAPVSWLVTFDVVRGRRHLNFSDWKSVSDPAFIADRAVRAVQNGDMPPSYYLLMHPKARLTDAQKQQLVAGLQQSLH